MAAYSFMDAGDKDFVTNYLWTNDVSKHNGGAIKYDLDYVVSGYTTNTCDLWEEIQSADFFWNRFVLLH
jgi:glucoamylase